ncbi:MAG: lipid-binding SYLF domain-containing protein [Xanthomonadales bacterium]|nr:lipid-binding SYLF domain-containing protein [Xanthomonadales bacterium]
MSKPKLHHLLLAAVLLLLPLSAVQAEDPPLVRADNAVRVLNEIMQAPDKSIPHDLLRDARAIAVIPGMIKAGFIFGGRRGEGLISVKTAEGTWSDPSFITMTGGSIGFQAGVSSTDVILVFRTQRGVDSIVNGKFTLGADASAAAGPVGRTAAAATDAQLNAEIYSYSRSRGLFAGVALDGSALRIDYDANAAIYGAGVTPRRIFEGGVSNVPAAVVKFRDQLEEYTAR